MNPAIAILGAGPSGLALARLLEVKKIDYVVFERDASATYTGRGGSLDIHTGSGQLALEKAGLFDQFKKLARYDGQQFKMLDSQANFLWDRGADGDDRPEIDRKDLRRILLDSVPEEKIWWDRKISSVNRDADGSMAVSFVNGDVEKGFKLVVGADGAWSKARALITSVKPQYAGIHYLQTAISTSNPIYSRVVKQCGLGSYMALTGGKSLIIMRQGDDSYMVYVGGRLPEDWTKTNADLMHSPEFPEYLATQYFEGWSSEITDLVRAADGEVFPWPLYAMPVEGLARESVPGVTLIGDAAHLALPNGEGVNIGMHEALQLAEEIESCGLDSLDEAVRKYEESMLPKGIEHIEDGNHMQDVFHSPDSVEKTKAWLASMGQGPS